MKYKTEEERREAKKKYDHEYFQTNKEKKQQYRKQYYNENKEQIRAYYKRYREEHRDPSRKRYRRYSSDEERTMYKSADSRLQNYRTEDLKYGREFSLTREWIVDRIFSSSCIYCGESDWHKLGCDRKDNSIGHTPENCVPSCKRCNEKRQRLGFHQFIGSLWSIQGRLRQQGSAQTRLVSVPRAVRIALGAFDQSSQVR